VIAIIHRSASISLRDDDDGDIDGDSNGVGNGFGDGNNCRGVTFAIVVGQGFREGVRCAVIRISFCQDQYAFGVRVCPCVD
jgi:hypothetical protein